MHNPRASKSERYARVTNSARLFTPVQIRAELIQSHMPLLMACMSWFGLDVGSICHLCAMHDVKTSLQNQI